jgi:glycosyltransferase involved in cell wall biosynthesis
MRTNAVVTRETAGRLAMWDGEQGREPGLIVSVGRLSPEKDHRTLLRAVARINSRQPWRLVIVGDGPERSALESFARQRGISERTQFVGYAPDPFDWMMRASVATCSSIYEGLCNAIIEALSCGTPVVSTDCPYGPREILQSGRFGALVPVGDDAAMAKEIEAALEHPADRAVLIARGLNYTAEHAAENFLEIVDALWS